MNKSTSKIILDCDTIFLDFDGVIKDSIRAKSKAFQRLFSNFNSKIVERILKHHQSHTGLSRFEKIPLYLSLVDEPLNEKNIAQYANNFSLLVKNLVIASPWVPGVLDFIEANYNEKNFYVITATPKNEIDEILKELKINSYFKEAYGTPISKIDAIKFVIENVRPKNAIMIGDSSSDFNAAKINNIKFVLRKTEFNLNLQNELDCPIFEDFISK